MYTCKYSTKIPTSQMENYVKICVCLGVYIFTKFIYENNNNNNNTTLAIAT